MEIILSNASPKPIYEQITSQIKAMIMNGELKAGDPMPSMRKLAKELHVSVITTQRAYDDLQKDGFIVTVPAKGTFVSAQNQDFIREDIEAYRKDSYGYRVLVNNKQGIRKVFSDLEIEQATIEDVMLYCVRGEKVA